MIRVSNVGSSTSRGRRAIAAAGVMALILAGCRQASRWSTGPRPIGLAEFSQPAEGSGPEAVVPGGGPDRVAGGAEVAAVAPPRPTEPAAVSQSPPADPVPASAEAVSSPPSAGADAPEPGERVIVDSLVGQVNGRPVFADEFFAPIEDQLIAEAEGKTRSEFGRAAREIVGKELREVVRNALFLAEAESQLTPEQQQGLFHWFRRLQEQVVGEKGGVEATAQQEFQAEGTTLDEYLKEKKDRALIRNLIQQKLQPRVIVSWRDIETEYRRRYDDYNPPAKATLARIRLATERQADEIEDVKRRLAAGEDFIELAESLDQRRYILGTFEFGTGGMSDISIRSDRLRESLAGLTSEGDTVGPVEEGNYTWWIHVAELEQQPGRSIYEPEVQRELRAYLMNVRGLQEQERYFTSLLEEGIYDDLQEMSDRLLTIALLRYGP